MKAIILLGGKGTRLLPLTARKPKPLISFFNRPLLTYQIELMKQYGVSEIIFSLGHLSERIEGFLKSEKNRGISIKWIVEEESLGTAGAVKNAQSMLGKETFLILNGDILTGINLAKLIHFHRLNKSRATIALTSVDDPTAYGLIRVDKIDAIQQFLEKPSWIEAGTCRTVNAGLYVFEPEVLSYIPPKRNFSLERELFPILLQRKEKFFGWETKDYWLDVGTLERYRQGHRDILEKKIIFPFLYFRKIEGGVWLEGSSRISPKANFIGPVLIGDNCKISDGVDVSPFTVIGENCIIENGANIANSIILRGTHIGKNVKMKSCIIGEACEIEDNAVISDGVALGDRSIVKAHSQL